MSKTTKSPQKIFIFLVASLIFATFIASAEVSSLGTFKQGQIVQLSQVCDNCTYVNLTQVVLPNSNGIITVGSLMTKRGQNYNYSFSSTSYIGEYFYTTCGDLNGILTCESVSFDVTPSGNSNVLGLYIIVIAIIYTIAFVGFFGRNEWISMLGGMALIVLGLFTINNGIDIFRNTITEVFSWTTIGVGAFMAIFTGTEIIRENL